MGIQNRWSGLALSVLLLMPTFAFAAELEGMLRNLVSAFTGRILPILALGYLGKNIFSHIRGEPDARDQTIRVVVAIVCLIGINAVWAFISQQAR